MKQVFVPHFEALPELITSMQPAEDQQNRSTVLDSPLGELVPFSRGYTCARLLDGVYHFEIEHRALTSQ